MKPTACAKSEGALKKEMRLKRGTPICEIDMSYDFEKKSIYRTDKITKSSLVTLVEVIFESATLFSSI